MVEFLLPWMQRLEGSAFGALMRSSELFYPAANLLHLAGLVMLLGAMLLLDLRLLGLAREVPVQAASRRLTPIGIAGLLLMLLTGFCLFAADAGPLLGNWLLQLKLLLVALGIINALLFRALWTASLEHWDLRPPLAGRLQVGLSILLWCGAMAAGRLLAYV
ncbi:hypothetical protein PCA10_51230 [Metapseudomonas resinovorans NBRC 106553]|uniref:DUF6644 domain-containing protein n=1 Tax=Metapseudomonas resinovorans NBRC 106553 TaxID=1245471 RepID=S6AP51_METRE|nr:hypothetical protein PCA10_51230 [Pseudomonas resinovorans NBRC 106553]